MDHHNDVNSSCIIPTERPIPGGNVSLNSDAPPPSDTCASERRESAEDNRLYDHESSSKHHSPPVVKTGAFQRIFASGVDHEMCLPKFDTQKAASSPTTTKPKDMASSPNCQKRGRFLVWPAELGNDLIVS